MRGPLVVLAGIVVVLVLFSCVYTVSETEQVILTQFGRPIGGGVDTPRPHFKVPVIQGVDTFHNRGVEVDGDANTIPTKEKKDNWVGT